MSKRQEIFRELAENLSLVSDRLNTDLLVERKDKVVVLSEFWRVFEESVKAVASECTKLCLAFSSRPLPSSAGCLSFRERIEAASLVLVSSVYRLRVSDGLELRKRVFDITGEIVRAVKALVVVIGERAADGHQEALQCTGGVWELCDSVPNLPHDNKQVAVQRTKQVHDLVKDALLELEEEIQNADPHEESDEMDRDDDDDDDVLLSGPVWCERDRICLAPGLGLVKVTRSALKKLNDAMKQRGDCSTGENVQDFDSVCERLCPISAQTDNLIEALYPPINPATLSHSAESLFTSTLSILSLCPGLHFVGESDAQWRDFLSKAAQHNWDKLQQFVCNDT